MQTTELETRRIIEEYRFNYKINKGNPFFIVQDDWNPINQRAFWLMDEKLITEYSVASWKVTPKKVNQ